VTISATHLDYAAGFLSWLLLSLGGGGAGVSRRIAARIATAAGSSIRSGSGVLPVAAWREAEADQAEQVPWPSKCTT